jgi:hypothetical protein
MPTERSKYRCNVRESTSGFFLAFEPTGGEQPRAIKGKLVCIDLRPGTTMEQAKALARELDKHMVGFAITD